MGKGRADGRKKAAGLALAQLHIARAGHVVTQDLLKILKAPPTFHSRDLLRRT